MLSQFFGGIGPAVFLVLTGITLSFLMDRRERQGLNAMARWRAALKRAGYLFTLAFLFRLQSQLLGWGALINFLKVDILNVMGVAMVAAFLLGAGGVKLMLDRQTRGRGALMVIAALVVVMNVMILTV